MHSSKKFKISNLPVGFKKSCTVCQLEKAWTFLIIFLLGLKVGYFLTIAFQGMNCKKMFFKETLVRNIFGGSFYEKRFHEISTLSKEVFISKKMVPVDHSFFKEGPTTPFREKFSWILWFTHFRQKLME